MEGSHYLGLVLLGVLTVLQSVRGAEDPGFCNAIPANSPATSTYVQEQCALTGNPPQDYATAVARAWEFAPVVYYHQLEQYFPDSIDHYLNSPNMTIYDADRVPLAGARVGGKLDELTLLNYAPAPGANDVQKQAAKAFFVSAMADVDIENSPLDDQWKRGAAFDAQNRSASKVYVKVNRGPAGNSFIFHYFYFFPWNGCSNQQVLNQDPRTLAQRKLDYYVCEFASHEGDWERVSVEVCADLTTTVRHQYAQHAWENERLCLGPNASASQPCRFFVNETTNTTTTHPLAFCSLFTHGHYADTADTFPYSQLQVPGLASLLAFSIVDRTDKGPKMLLPTTDNIIPIDSVEYPIEPNRDEFVAAYNANGLTPAQSWTKNQSWVAFLGRYGNSFFSQLRDLNEPRCFNSDFTSDGTCENDVLFELVRVLLGISNDKRLQSIRASLESRPELKEVLATFGPVGPRAKGWYQNWTSAADSPSSIAEIICPNRALLTDKSLLVERIEARKTALTAGWVALAVAAGVASTLFVISMVSTQTAWSEFWSMLRNGNPEKDTQRLETFESTCGPVRNCLRTLPVFSIVGMCVSISGGVLMFNGLQSSIELLQLYVDDESWEFFTLFIQAVVPTILLIDIAGLVVAFCARGALFERCCLKRTAWCGKQFQNYGLFINVGMLLFLWLAAFVDVVALIYGSLFLGIHTGALAGCTQLDKLQDELGARWATLAGVCIKLDDFGLDDIFCGNDLTTFCNNWRIVDGREVVVGALLINMGQLIFVSVGGFNLHRLNTLNHLRREEDDKTIALVYAKYIDPEAGDKHLQSRVKLKKLHVRDVEQSGVSNSGTVELQSTQGDTSSRATNIRQDTMSNVASQQTIDEQKAYARDADQGIPL